MAALSNAQFCYDRQKAGLKPACATACPTESIKFGPIEEMRAAADNRIEELHQRGMLDAQIYNPTDTSVRGLHALFITRGDPSEYNLPPQPEVPTTYLSDAQKSVRFGGRSISAGQSVCIPRERAPMSDLVFNLPNEYTQHGWQSNKEARLEELPCARERVRYD